MALANVHHTAKGRSKRKLVLGSLVSVGLIFGIARFADISNAAERFEDFQWSFLPWMLAAVLGYYLLKAVRWHIFLRAVGVAIPLRTSLLVYLSGQWFAFSPAGEFVKVYLLGRYGVDYAKASATIVMQVAVDFICLAVLGSVTLLWYPGLSYVVLPFSGLVILGVGVLSQEQLWKRIAPFQSASILDRVRPSLEVLFHSISQLAGGRSLMLGLALGFPTILLGSLTLLLAAVGYAAPVDFTQSTFVYSLSQLLGAMSMLPHGLGAVEGSSLALFDQVGVGNVAHAAAIIALFRLASLVWGIGIGGLTLVAMPFFHLRPASIPMTQIPEGS